MSARVRVEKLGWSQGASWIVSLVAAYAVCALSGVNRLMSIALKAYYSLWVVLTWGLLAIILIGLSGQSSRAWWRWLLVGVAAGYIAGILVYQIAPAIMAGSVHNALAIMRAGGLLTHIGLSMLVPLMTMSWLLGLITAAMFAAVKRHSGHDIRVALYIVGTVVICGWVFFLAQQRIPVKW